MSKQKEQAPISLDEYLSSGFPTRRPDECQQVKPADDETPPAKEKPFKVLW